MTFSLVASNGDSGENTLSEILHRLVLNIYSTGGPLMAYHTHNNIASWYLAGIVSYGPIECGTENIPGKMNFQIAS